MVGSACRLAAGVIGTAFRCSCLLQPASRWSTDKPGRHRSGPLSRLLFIPIIPALLLRQPDIVQKNFRLRSSLYLKSALTKTPDVLYSES